MKHKYFILFLTIINILFSDILLSQNNKTDNTTGIKTDSIINISDSSVIKHHNIRILQKNIISKSAELNDKDRIIEKLQHTKKIILIVGIIILTIFIILIFIAGKQYKKINTKFTEKNNEIITQREEIEEQKNHITQKTIDLLVLNKKLKENNDLREGLTSMIVHDLKNPISNIINLSENREITFFAKEMLTMVENILDIQKYEGMIMPLKFANISLKRVVNEAKSEISLYAEHKNIEIRNTVADKINVFADEEIIRRVFVNLLSNAIKYTFNNGLIKIESEIDNTNSEKIKIKVTDNGMGIKKDKIPMIFNKFSQIVAKNTGEARSTGIGLTFCKMAVEAHESDITVKSVPGKFTSFEFYLPVKIIENFSSKNNINENKTKQSCLNTEDKKYLEKIYNDIKNTDVYEISKIRVILNSVDEKFSDNVKMWKKNLNNAVYNCNFELYNKLRDEIVIN
ncbi:MAG: HAMP domain-containing histidine kinase [Bacteroidales bacterium]|nr:HAMP domain-containing histidine kinase [Bacteroidales bacterium]